MSREWIIDDDFLDEETKSSADGQGYLTELVRCKECRWYEINELKADGTEDRRYKPSMCVLHNRSFKDTYYCADGERKEE